MLEQLINALYCAPPELSTVLSQECWRIVCAIAAHPILEERAPVGQRVWTQIPLPMESHNR